MVLTVCGIIFIAICVIYLYKLYKIRDYKWQFIKITKLNYTSDELVIDYKCRLKRKIKVAFGLLVITAILFFLQYNVDAFNNAMSIDPLFSTSLFSK